MTKEEFFRGSDPNDLETQRLLEDSWNNRINIDEIGKGLLSKNEDPFEDIRTTKTFEEISNEIALRMPFGKESVFYRPKENSLRAFLNNKGNYLNAKKYFPDIDLEKISITEYSKSFNNIKYA